MKKQNFFLKIINALDYAIMYVFQFLVMLGFCVLSSFKYRMKFEKNGYQLPKGPKVFISNHQCNYDMFFLRKMFLTTHTYYLAHDQIFENKIVGFFAKHLLGCVKRGTSTMDLAGLKTIMSYTRNNKNICIFYEGGLPYFTKGKESEINLAKMCKMMNASIVVMNIHGMRSLKPRWSQHKAKVLMCYEIKTILKKEEIKTMKIQDLHEILKSNLLVDDGRYYEVNQTKVKRKDCACQLNKGLFLCPSCQELSTLESNKNLLICKKCQFRFELTPYDTLKIKGFDNTLTLDEFDQYQKEKVKQLLSNYSYLILKSENLVYYKKDLNSKKQKKQVENCKIKLYHDYLILESHNEKHIFLINEIYNCYCEFRDTLQFNYNNIRYRIYDQDETFSAYHYASILNLLGAKSNK